MAYLTLFVPGLAASPAAAAAVAIGAIWVAVAINAAGVRTAGSVQVVTTVLKVLPLAAVGLFGLTYFDATHFAVASTDARSLLAGVPAVATLTLFAYLGLESATIPAGSIRDPARTIPRATLIGTALTAVVYIVTTVGVMSVLAPAQLSTSAAPFADAATTMAGGWAGRVVAAGAVISCFGALNGWTLVAGQLPLAVAQDGLFPGVFARLSGRGTPTAGFVIAGLLTTALVVLNYTRGLVDIFTFFILLSTLANLIPYAFCSLAIFLLRDDAAGGPLPTGVAITAGLAFVYALWAMGGAGYEAVYWGFLLLIGGLPVYVVVARRGSRRRGTPAVEPVAIGTTGP